jgi:hypothetical protein
VQTSVLKWHEDRVKMSEKTTYPGLPEITTYRNENKGD